MPQTSIWGWKYPTEGQKNWYSIFQTRMNQQDFDVWAAYENPNLVLRGGGTISLDTGSDELTWDEDFEILSMLSGGIITIEAATLTGFTDGKIACIEISRPVSGGVVATLEVANVLTTETSKLFVAVRRGNAVYFRNQATRDAVTFVNKTGAKKITSSVVSDSGGTVSGSIQVGAVEGSMWFLKATALGNTVDSSIEFFSDVGETDRLYEAPNKDMYSASYEDRTTWYIGPLTNGLLYYKLTNDGANSSAYEIELSGIGRMEG